MATNWLSVGADGAYDQRSCYEAINRRQAKAAISPRRRGAHLAER
jgi:hypothetical protein